MGDGEAPGLAGAAGGGQGQARRGREKTRSVGMVRTTRYSVDHKRLNNLLDPETRAGIVTENVSEYLRVS